MSQENELKLLQEIERLKRQVERLKVGEVGGGDWVYLIEPLTSTSWDGDARSTTAKTKIDLSAVFGAPAGIKAVLLEVAARDSGSAGVETRIRFSPNDTANSSAMECYLTGRTNDQYNVSSGLCPCDANGDIYYQITASGANSMDVYLRIWGYWL